MSRDCLGVVMKRIYALDGLRGIAAIAVMLFHIGQSYASPLMASGYLAVDLFFILSGFILAKRYSQNLTDGLGTKAFMIGRVNRLYPIFLVGIALGTVRSLGAMALGIDAAPTAPELFRQVVLNGLILPDVFNIRTLFPLNTPAWSLFFEFVVNVFFAAVLYRFASRGLIVLAVFCAGIMLAGLVNNGTLDIGWSRETIVFGLARATAGFCIGMLLERFLPERPLPKPLSVFLLIGVFGILWLAPAPEARIVYDFTVAMILSPIIIGLCYNTDVPAMLKRPFTLLGAISYPLYAIHYPMIQPLKLVGEKLHASPPLAMAAIALITCAAAFVLGKTDEHFRAVIKNKSRNLRPSL